MRLYGVLVSFVATAARDADRWSFRAPPLLLRLSVFLMLCLPQLEMRIGASFPLSVYDSST